MVRNILLSISLFLSNSSEGCSMNFTCTNCNELVARKCLFIVHRLHSYLNLSRISPRTV
jgi:hypothetical protein